MNSTKIDSLASIAVRGVLGFIAFTGTLGQAPRIAAQSYDFNAGNDSGWSHYDLGFAGLPSTYSFPADLGGGHAYRIVVPPTGANSTTPPGPGRTLVFPSTAYSGRFTVGVDLIAWRNTIDQAFGPFWYAQNIGPGTSTGYAMTYEPVGHVLRISLINAEAPTYIGLVNNVVLDPAAAYRLVASTHDGSTYLGQVFKLSDLLNPVASAVASDASHSAGLCALLVYDASSPSVTGGDVTFDNYLAAVAPANSLPATIVRLTPSPLEHSPLLFPTISAAILDRDTTTTADPSALLLWLDGRLLTAGEVTIDSEVAEPSNPNPPNAFAGATISYAVTNLFAPGSRHTNAVAFLDSASVWRTNTWTWTTSYRFLSSSNSLPLGSLSLRGFDTRVARSLNGGVNLENSLARANQQLAVPPQIPVDLVSTGLVAALDWNQGGSPTNVPGLCPAGEIKNLAAETLAYLELSAGPHRFHIITDDRAGFYSGANLRDSSASLFEALDNTANTNFDFVVEADGLYPVRCLWEQTGGGAVLTVRSVSLDDNSEVVLNDPNDPSGVVKAWYPLLCLSSPTVTGPFTIDPTAVNGVTLADVPCNGTGAVLNQRVAGGTFSVPVSGNTRFYRLDGPSPTRITSISYFGSNVILTYQVN